MDSKRKINEETGNRKREAQKAVTIAGTSESGSEEPNQEDDGAGPPNVRDDRSRKKQEYNLDELELAFECYNAAPGGFKRNAHHLLNQLGGKVTTLRKALRDANLKWGQPTTKQVYPFKLCNPQAERMEEAYSQRMSDGDTVKNALEIVAKKVPGGWRPWQVRKILKERGVDIPDGSTAPGGSDYAAYLDVT